jgi:hypothetical protein
MVRAIWEGQIRTEPIPWTWALSFPIILIKTELMKRIRKIACHTIYSI